MYLEAVWHASACRMRTMGGLSMKSILCRLEQAAGRSRCQDRRKGVMRMRFRFSRPLWITFPRADPLMQEEIFGPILPVMTFHDLSEVISYVTRHDRPLAL